MSLHPAYLAGILDATGRIRTRTTPTGTDLAVVAVSSPNLALLDTLAQATGVRVVPVNRTYNRVGCSQHCLEPHLHVVSYTGRWELVGARAVVVLRAIRPHLHTLGDEADTVLRQCGDAPVKPATLRKMRDLGWAA